MRCNKSLRHLRRTIGSTPHQLQSQCATPPVTFAVAALQLSAGVAAVRALHELRCEPTDLLPPQRCASLPDEAATIEHLRRSAHRYHHLDEVPLLSRLCHSGPPQRCTAPCRYPPARTIGRSHQGQSGNLCSCPDRTRHGLAKTRPSCSSLLAFKTDLTSFHSRPYFKAPLLRVSRRMRTVSSSIRPLSNHRCIRSLVRRILSISLLLLFMLPLVSPLFAASTADANVPVCCRRNGEHHCVMAKIAQHSSSDTKAASIQASCPYNPVTPAAVNLPFVPDEVRTATFADALSDPACPAQSPVRIRIPLDRSHRKRGPPSLILSRS